MSQQNKTTLQAAINSNLADNTTGNIGAADIRDNLINITDSLLFNSGSQSITGSLIATQGFTGSLQGIATTSSFVNPLRQTVQITGSTLITGSLGVTGSISTSGSNGTINDLFFSRGGGNVPSNISIGKTTNFSSSATGTNNIAIGCAALYTNTIGSFNTAIGYKALNANTTGTNNTAIGQFSLFTNTSGSNNTAIGNNALVANTSGSHNTAIGCYALFYNTTGTDNTAIGRCALYNNTIGSNNIAFGQNAGTCFCENSSNNIAIGFGAGPSTATQESNKLYIASGSGTPLIKGDFAAKGVSITSFLNLSGSNPLPSSGEFSCNGTIAFSSSGNFFFRSASAWCKLKIN